MGTTILFYPVNFTFIFFYKPLKYRIVQDRICLVNQVLGESNSAININPIL